MVTDSCLVDRRVFLNLVGSYLPFQAWTLGRGQNNGKFVGDLVRRYFVYVEAHEERGWCGRLAKFVEAGRQA